MSVAPFTRAFLKSPSSRGLSAIAKLRVGIQVYLENVYIKFVRQSLLSLYLFLFTWSIRCLWQHWSCYSLISLRSQIAYLYGLEFTVLVSLLHLTGSIPAFQIVYWLSVHMISLNLTKVAMAYTTRLSIGLPPTSTWTPSLSFFTHSIRPLSVHSFHYCHSIIRWWYPAVFSFQPTSFTENSSRLQASLGSIASWITSNLLCLNSANTEFLWLGLKPQLNKINNPTLLLTDNHSVPPTASARNLGFIFDFRLSFSDHISSVSRACFYHIRDLRRIRYARFLALIRLAPSTHLLFTSDSTTAIRCTICLPAVKSPSAYPDCTCSCCCRT